MSQPLVDISKLLSTFDAFIDTMYTVRADFSQEPTREHVATCINYADLQEMRSDFVRELANTATTWVYAPTKQERLIEQLSTRRSPDAAWRHLWTMVRDKFRRSSVRGQFSELLLSNILQHFYHATPLLRKMAITTNPEVERHGADAIHVGVGGGKYLLYLGEAKTYTRAGGGLRDGLHDAIKGAIEQYEGHRKELSLYTYEDFLPPELEQVARDYQEGRLANIEVHLVCMVTYNPAHALQGASRDEFLACTVDGIQQEMAALTSSVIFNKIPAMLRPRMNYVLFSVREMEDLLAEFALEMGMPVKETSLLEGKRGAPKKAKGSKSTKAGKGGADAD